MVPSCHFLRGISEQWFGVAPLPRISSTILRRASFLRELRETGKGQKAAERIDLHVRPVLPISECGFRNAGWWSNRWRRRLPQVRRAEGEGLESRAGNKARVGNRDSFRPRSRALAGGAGRSAEGNDWSRTQGGVVTIRFLPPSVLLPRYRSEFRAQ